MGVWKVVMPRVALEPAVGFQIGPYKACGEGKNYRRIQRAESQHWIGQHVRWAHGVENSACEQSKGPPRDLLVTTSAKILDQLQAEGQLAGSAVKVVGRAQQRRTQTTSDVKARQQVLTKALPKR